MMDRRHDWELPLIGFLLSLALSGAVLCAILYGLWSLGRAILG